MSRVRAMGLERTWPPDSAGAARMAIGCVCQFHHVPSALGAIKRSAPPVYPGHDTRLRLGAVDSGA